MHQSIEKCDFWEQYKRIWFKFSISVFSGCAAALAFRYKHSPLSHSVTSVCVNQWCEKCLRYVNWSPWRSWMNMWHHPQPPSHVATRSSCLWPQSNQLPCSSSTKSSKVTLHCWRQSTTVLPRTRPHIYMTTHDEAPHQGTTVTVQRQTQNIDSHMYFLLKSGSTTIQKWSTELWSHKKTEKWRIHRHFSMYFHLFCSVSEGEKLNVFLMKPKQLVSLQDSVEVWSGPWPAQKVRVHIAFRHQGHSWAVDYLYTVLVYVLILTHSQRIIQMNWNIYQATSSGVK